MAIFASLSRDGNCFPDTGWLLLSRHSMAIASQALDGLAFPDTEWLRLPRYWMAGNWTPIVGWSDFWQLTPMNLAIWESLCTGEIRLYAKNQNFSLTNEVWPPFLIFLIF